MLLNIFDTTLPIQDPVLRLLVVLAIILLAPLLLNKLKIPHLLGLIIAGAVIGPYGLNVLERDSSIVVTGTTGLLYIMFLAGLEIDLTDFKRNKNKSIVFGLYTFVIPLVLGFLAVHYIMGYSVLTSVLLASMFSSHTLIAYPIASKFGVTKNLAVNVAVGGTMITDTLALMVLAIVVGMTKGNVDAMFWFSLITSIVLFGLAVLLLFPIIGRWFFKKVNDKVLQYVFVLAMMYLAAVMAEMAGVEPIIGAFLAGLALNRLIPHTSALMNRIEFVGNAYFIPFFLISVGMLINKAAFFTGKETIMVAVVMTVVAIISKAIAAYLTKRTFRFNKDQFQLIFGLSSAQAAATLAAVMVGYNIILYEDEAGNPVRLLNDAVLNGTILMILVTCTVATFITQKGAKNISMSNVADGPADEEMSQPDHILIAVSVPETVDPLVNLGLTMQSNHPANKLIALNVIDDKNPANQKNAAKLMEMATHATNAIDKIVTPLVRYDENIVNGIVGEINKNEATDVILAVNNKKGISPSFIQNVTQGILKRSNITTFLYKSSQPLSTVKKYILIIPPNAEKETGFGHWLVKVWTLVKNSGAKLKIYANERMIEILKKVQAQNHVECHFTVFEDWDEILAITKDAGNNACLVFVLSRPENISYHRRMNNLPSYLNNYFEQVNYIVVYPMQEMKQEDEVYNLNSGSILEPIDQLVSNVQNIFTRSNRGAKAH